jgi:hypothetical protein
VVLALFARTMTEQKFGEAQNQSISVLWLQLIRYVVRSFQTLNKN